MKKLLFILFFPLLAGAQTTPLTFTALANNDYVGPGRGSEMWNGEWPWNNTTSVQVPSGTPEGKNMYRRWNWYDFENVTQGSYDWTSFDAVANRAIDNGEKLSFGIMSVCSGCGGAPGYAGAGQLTYPRYLHTLMQGETTKDWQNASGLWVPNWNSTNYLSRVEALLSALATHINATSHSGVLYKNIIYYVDIRHYGDYGEWHNCCYLTETPAAALATSASLIRIIDAYRTYFPNYPLVILENAYDHGAPTAGMIPLDVSYYALTATNSWGPIGWRRDNWGEANEDNRLANNPYSFNGLQFNTSILNRYQFAPVVGEPSQNSGNVTSGGTLYGDLTREITLYHPTSIGNGNYPSSNATDANLRVNVIAASRQMGYNLKITGGSMTTTLTPSGSFSVSLIYNNSGVSPTYMGWKTYIVAKQGGVVKQTFTSTFNPKPLLPGTSLTQTDNFTFGALPAGTYDFYVRIDDTTGFYAPLPLMITGRQSDGSYPIRLGVSVSGTPNQPPIAVITPSPVSLTLPTSSQAFSGTSSTDADGSIVSYAWNQIMGPSAASFSTPSASTCTMSGMIQGLYVFRLLVTDNLGGTGSVTVNVNVSHLNKSPTAIITPSGITSLTLPTSSQALSGATSIDSDGVIACYQWNFISGPSPAVIDSPTKATVIVSGMISAGVYIFNLLVADDSTAIGTTSKTIIVSAAVVLPTAQINGSSSITLPVSSTNLDGTTSFAGGGHSIASYAWSTLSGAPNSPTIVSPTGSSTNVTGLIAGTYNFRLLVTDNVGGIGADTLTLVVNPASTTDLNVFTTQTPANNISNDGFALTLGMKFRSSIDAYVTGVRFYKVVGNNGAHQGMIYDASGNQLAIVTFANESASGWQTATFNQPVLIANNTTYIIAYFSPGGYYVYTTAGLATAIVNNTLTGLADGTDGFNGMYQYGASPAFPQSNSVVGGGKVNYWVDVIVAANIGSSCGPNCMLRIPFGRVSN